MTFAHHLANVKHVALHSLQGVAWQRPTQLTSSRTRTFGWYSSRRLGRHRGGARRARADPSRADYHSFMPFEDPDGKGWMVQEIFLRAWRSREHDTHAAPGRHPLRRPIAPCSVRAQHCKGTCLRSDAAVPHVLRWAGGISAAARASVRRKPGGAWRLLPTRAHRSTSCADVTAVERRSRRLGQAVPIIR
jgi:hypothetical protein